MKLKLTKILGLTFVLGQLPLVVDAAGVSSLIDRVYFIIKNNLIPLGFALCMLYFLWGVTKYIKSANPGNKEEGKQVMIWGVVGLFVAFSIWGIVTLIRSELGIPPVTNVNVQN